MNDSPGAYILFFELILLRRGRLSRLENIRQAHG